MNTELDHKLDQLLAQTPREIRPANALWPNIAKRIKASERNHAWPLVASLLIGLSLGLLGGSQLQSPPPQLAIEPLLQALEQQHQLRLAKLPQESPWVAATDLSALRSGSQQVYQELLQQPDNQQLFSLWLWTQQRELELRQPQLHQSL